MNRRTGLWIVAAACGALLSLPAIAGASITKVVYAGPPPGTSKIAQKLTSKGFRANNPDINSFFRQRVTINVGDKVSFQRRGFHTIDLPGGSKKDLPLFVPGATVTGVNDAAGNPFWFNGHVPSLGFDPMLFSSSGPITYNGTARIDTGLPLAPGTPKPLVVKFTKPGTYKFFCDVHPGMVGYVVVKGKGAPIPSATQDAAALTAEITADIKVAKKLAKSKPPANTVSLGESSSDGVELYRMFPASLTVKAPTVVTFTMSRDSRETHTATFGPAPYLTTLSNGLNSPAIPQQALYPSDPPGTVTLTPTSHGNGFANTGALDRDPATPPPSSGTIDFTTPGTYHYQCLIHPFMHGTIIVK